MTNNKEDCLDKPIWGAQNFAPVIGRSVQKTYYLLDRGLLDATKVGRLHVSTPRRLLNSLGISAGRTEPQSA
jgi:hypothetical protein